MTRKEVEKVIEENNLKLEDFDKFIENQTVGIDKDGSVNYYGADVEKFVYLSKNN